VSSRPATRRAARAAWAAWVALAAAAAAAGCGGKSRRETITAATPAPVAPADRMLAMLPQGAQVVVEVDLARLRGNPVLGDVITRVLASGMPLPGAAAAGIAGEPAAAAGEPAAAAGEPPLAVADAVLLAAYGVGTAQAATVTLLAARQPIAGAARIADGVYAVGPEAWTAQVAQRGALLEASGLIRAEPELLALRGRAMPPRAPGAVLRLTARLGFDARVALARQTGLEAAPAQLSIWGDVVDDLAVVVEADAADPGDRGARGAKQAAARLEAALRGALASLAAEPAAQALGLPRSLTGAKLTVRGTWVRAIIAIGPEHLKRVAARAGALLPATPDAAPPQGPVPPP